MIIKNEVSIEAINTKNHSGIKWNGTWFNGEPEILKEIKIGDIVTFSHDESNKVIEILKITKPEVKKDDYWTLRLQRDIENDKFYQYKAKLELALKIIEISEERYTEEEIIKKAKTLMRTI